MTNGTKIKPGWKTTEFWIALVTNIVAVGVLTGRIAPEMAAETTNAAGQIAAGIIAAISNAVYIFGRYKVKA